MPIVSITLLSETVNLLADGFYGSGRISGELDADSISSAGLGVKPICRVLDLNSS
jgi:hypothetical protein